MYPLIIYPIAPSVRREGAQMTHDEREGAQTTYDKWEGETMAHDEWEGEAIAHNEGDVILAAGLTLFA